MEIHNCKSLKLLLVLLEVLITIFGGVQCLKASYPSLEEIDDHICNPVPRMQLGAEGNGTEGKLEAVVLVTRHGDRSPFYPIRNINDVDCGLSENSDDFELLVQYQKALSSVHRITESSDPFGNFALFPSGKSCTLGELTTIGATQHLKLGRMLNSAYIQEKNLLSKESYEDSIEIHSTQTSRTYQSALAFLYTFLPEFNFQKVRILPSKSRIDGSFCGTEDVCSCPAQYEYVELLSELIQTYLELRPSSFGLVEVANLIMELSNVPHGVEYTYECIGVYRCHKSPYPCLPHTDQCITDTFVQRLFGIFNDGRMRLQRDEKYSKVKRLMVYGLLKQLSTRLQDVAKGSSSVRFTLFSAHDITVDYLLSALGFDSEWNPPYASRLAFELYTSNEHNEKRHFFSVIYNGLNITKKISICSGISQNACPLERLQEYVEKGFFAPFNVTHFQAACDSVFPNMGYVKESLRHKI